MTNNRNNDLSGATENTVGAASITPEKAPPPPPSLSVHIAANRMTAYLRVQTADKSQTVSTEEVLDFLGKNQVCYGICVPEIEAYCKEKRFFQELVCARGEKPIDGKDGVLQYHIPTELSATPKEREDGTVDFLNLNLIHNVVKGETLCSRTMPTEGSPGIDIYNQPVQAYAGKELLLPIGKNTVTSEDGLKLLAEVDGCIELQRGAVNVNEVYSIRGNVDHSTGNIDAVGSVAVYGVVKEGFTVKAGKDVQIYGLVEGSTIEAGENIILKEGMNGMNQGLLKAGGNVVGKFFENVRIECDGDISCEILLNCRVIAKGSVILKGKKAAIIGGKCQAGQKISAGSIGTSSYVETKVSLLSEEIVSGLDHGEVTPTDELQTRREDILQTLKKMEAEVQTGTVSPQNRRLLLVQAGKFKGDIRKIEEEIERRAMQAQRLADHIIAVQQRAFPGVKVTIGPFSMRLEQPFDNSKFYLNENGVTFGPLLPSDR